MLTDRSFCMDTFMDPLLPTPRNGGSQVEGHQMNGLSKSIINLRRTAAPPPSWNGGGVDLQTGYPDRVRTPRIPKISIR